MRCILFMAACLFVGPFITGCVREPESPRNFTVVEPNPAEGDLAPILKAEAAKALQLGRKPFVEFGATWCGPCNALKKSLNDPLMKQAFEGTYIIQIDVD